MKKLMLLGLVLLISLPSFAKLKEKDVTGKWTYKIETDQGDLVGTLQFEKKDGKLVGEVYTDDGQTFPFTRLEIRKKDVLYSELYDGNQTYKILVTLKGKAFEGTVTNDQGEFPISMEKAE